MITWNEHYQMGVPELDQEHRQLFRIAEGILRRVRTQGEDPATRMFVLREGLNYLQGYFAQHAAQEEAYMRRIGYDGYALHKRMHSDFEAVQMAKYRAIVQSGACTREDVWDFVGTGIGWLLDHIATADLAIVGRGVLAEPVRESLDTAALERELDQLFAATLNLTANVKVLRTWYTGEPFGKAVCQRIRYRAGEEEITVLSGIERSFLLEVARGLYGGEAEDEMDLVLSTLEMFGAQFWIFLGRQLTGNRREVSVRENRFLPSSALAGELEALRPTLSILFTSDLGRFFVASSSAQVGRLVRSLA